MMFYYVALSLMLSVILTNGEIIGAGYNILTGNPDGINPLHGGHDQGIIYRKILNTKQQVIPKAIELNSSTECLTSSVVEWFHGDKSYQEKLKKSVQTSGDGNFHIQQVAFKLSPQFIYHQQNTFPNHRITQEVQTICEYGGTKNIMDTIGSQYFPLTENFAAAVCDLSNKYDMDEYRSFLEKWGTHVIVAADFGTKKINRYESIDVAFYKHVNEKLPEGIFSNGTADGRKVNLDVFRGSMLYSKPFGNYIGTLLIGTPTKHEPIKLKLISIDMLLQSKFWKNLDSLIAHSICNEQTTTASITAKKAYIVQALDAYSTSSYIPQDQSVSVPIVWPRGTYALLNTKTRYNNKRCPSGVSWDTSDVTWCTDTSSSSRYYQQSSNDKSQSSHFDGYIQFGSIVLNFCVKREVSTNRERQVLDWPKGNYCIVKYNSCPKGFSEGSVQWDSRDQQYSSSCNRAQKYSPDGSYGKDVLMRFCCRNDSDVKSPIYLPTNTPFYLIKNNEASDCQHVVGMTVKEEYITWDNDDATPLYNSTNMKVTSGAHPLVKLSDNYDITMYFCYYYRLESDKF